MVLVSGANIILIFTPPQIFIKKISSKLYVFDEVAFFVDEAKKDGDERKS